MHNPDKSIRKIIRDLNSSTPFEKNKLCIIGEKVWIASERDECEKKDTQRRAKSRVLKADMSGLIERTCSREAVYLLKADMPFIERARAEIA